MPLCSNGSASLLSSGSSADPITIIERRSKRHKAHGYKRRARKLANALKKPFAVVHYHQKFGSHGVSYAAIGLFDAGLSTLFNQATIIHVEYGGMSRNRVTQALHELDYDLVYGGYRRVEA